MHDYSKLPGTKKMRFREWLKEKLDKNEVAGLEWIDRPRGLFKIPWKHGSRHGWNMDRDAEIFKQWAIHSGRYREGVDKPDPAKWKTNFRCTLNALSDFREVRGKSFPRGPNACKIYIMNSEELKTEQKANGPNGEKQTQKLDLTDKEIVQMLDDIISTSQTNQKPLIISRRPNSAFPAFETLVVDKTRNVFPISCPTPWFLAAWNAMAVDQFVQKPADNPADDPEGKAAKNITEKALEKQDQTSE